MAPLRRGSRTWSSEEGAELVEFAIVLPLMLLVLFGIIDFGLLFQRYQVVTNAAREGARIAVLPGYGDADVQTRVSQFLSAAGLTETATVPSPARSSISLGTQCISVVSVSVDYPYSYSAIGGLASYFGGSAFSNGGLHATAAMRSELAAACP
jgi:Flp pilus assembly protein TadG